MNISKQILPIVLGSAISLVIQNADAANHVWSGGGADNNWSTAANWGGAALVNGDTLTFSGSLQQLTTNNINNYTNGWISFNNGGFTLKGNGFVMNPSNIGLISNLAGLNTIANDLIITPAAKYWVVAAGSEVCLTGTITNTSAVGTSSGWLCLTNGGTVRIKGTAGSARGMDLFQGTVVIDGGNVYAGSDGIRFKPPTGSTAAVVLTNNGILRVDGGGNFRLGHNGTVIGGIAGANSLSQMILSSGTLELKGAATSVLVGDQVAGAKGVFDQNGGLVWGSAGAGNTLTIGGVVNADGTYNLNGGTLWISQVKIGNAGATNAVFNFNGGILRPTTNSTAFFQGLLQANLLSGGAIIDTTNFSVTVSQSLTGSGGLTKLGNGTLILSGNDSYTGGTVVSAGTLVVSNSVLTGGGSLTVANGAGLGYSFGGSSLAVSSLSLGAGGSATLNLNLGTGNPVSTPIVAGTLTGAGSVTVNIAGQNLTVGQITLVTSTSATGLNNFHLGTIPLGLTATLSTTANSIVLNITKSVKALVWSGASSSQWDTSSLNWKDSNTGSASVYSQNEAFGDVVTFDDSSSQFAVNLTTAVKPVSTTFSGYNFYTLAGSGKISGAGALTLNAWGYTSLATVNDYTGGTVLNAGYLYLGADQALGSGPVTLNSGYISSDSTTPRTVSSPFVFNTDTGVFLGDTAYTGALTLAGGVDLGGKNTRALNFYSDIIISGPMTNGGITLKTGRGRMIITGQAQQAALASQQQGDVVINGGRFDSLEGWRMQSTDAGNTTSFIVTNGGIFNLITPTGNFRVGLAGGDNSANNVVEVAGTMALASTSGNCRVDMGQSGANDVVNLYSTGKLICRSITSTSPANTELNLFGGTLTPIVDEPAFITGLTNAFVHNGGVVVDTTNFNITIGQALLWDGVGSGGLTKWGSGTLTLTGASTYTGPTLVNSGKLVLGAAFAAPSGISVAANTTLAFLTTGTGAKASVPSVTTVNGSVLEAEFTGFSANPTNAAGFINNLALSGVVKVNVTGLFANGQFPLLGYGAISGTGSLVLGQLPRGTVATLVTNTSAKTIDLVVAGVSPLLWAGAVNGTWDLTTANWNLLGSPSTFSQNDNVLFNDSSANSAVNLTTTVSPGSLIVSNTALSYQFTGSGISGNMSLTKLGTNTLSLATPNTFVGNINVNAGTLVAANATALGSSNNTVTITNGATLDILGNNLGLQPIVVGGSGFNGTGALVNSGVDQNDALRSVVLTGDTTINSAVNLGLRTKADTDLGLVANGHKLTKIGPGSFNLNGGSNLGTVTNSVVGTDLGDVDVQQGTISFQRRSALGTNNTITVRAGANLILFALNSTLPVPTSSIILTNASLQGNGLVATDTNTIAGRISLYGASNSVNALIGTTLNLNGPLVGAGGVTFGGRVNLSGANSYVGATIITNGTLILGTSGQLSGTTNITVASGATLDVSALPTWTLGAGQVFGGAGTVLGNVVANGTVSLGSSINALTFSNNLTLAGSTLLKVSKGASDVVKVAGTLAYGGQLKVVFTGSTALAIGDTFTLFNFTGAPSGIFSISLPSNYTWDTTRLAVDGTIKVTGLPTPPVIDSVTFSGGNLVMSGTGGTSSGNYYFLTSTNVALPLSSWVASPTNAFDVNGKFSTSIPATEKTRFYKLMVP